MNEDYTKVVMSLIRNFSENNEEDYKLDICRLSNLLQKDGKTELAEYVVAQVGIGPVFVPQ